MSTKLSTEQIQKAQATVKNMVSAGTAERDIRRHFSPHIHHKTVQSWIDTFKRELFPDAEQTLQDLEHMERRDPGTTAPRTPKKGYEFANKPPVTDPADEKKKGDSERGQRLATELEQLLEEPEIKSLLGHTIQHFDQKARRIDILLQALQVVLSDQPSARYLCRHIRIAFKEFSQLSS
jgi:hypothetical protein